MRFSSGKLKFNPSSIKVFFRKQPLAEWNNAANGQSIKSTQDLTFSVSFRKYSIDFFGFSKDRIFLVMFAYSLNGLEFNVNFSVHLPVIKQAELHFKPPGTTYPDTITRGICQQAFQMNEDNSDDQLRRCILLEEFKLMPIVERYKAYGYVSMLNLFLDVENSFELDLLQKSTLSNATVLKISAIQYKINVSLFKSNESLTIERFSISFRLKSLVAFHQQRLQYA